MKYILPLIVSGFLFLAAAPAARAEAKSVASWPLGGFWTSNTMARESVLFLSPPGGGPPQGRLLFTPTAIQRVERPSTGETYEEGVDYVVNTAQRTINLPEGSRIPFSTFDAMYPLRGTGTFHHVDGIHDLLWREGHYFHDLQIEVTYAHGGTEWAAWGGYVPQSAVETLTHTMTKLATHNAVKMLLIGDSISVGANASGFASIAVPPNMPPFGELVSQQLQSHYGTAVQFTNLSEGGRDSAWGVTKIPNIIAANPDLVLLGFGMNDCNMAVSTTQYRANMAKMIADIRAANPNTESVLIASMLPNPEWEGTSISRFQAFRDQLQSLTGPGVALADMTSVYTTLVSQGKPYYEFTGNNINHPNDFGHRLYAQVILALLRANPEPFRFTKRPVGGLKEVGQPLELEVAVTGTAGEVRYQWIKDESEIEGATSQTFVIPSLRLNDEGYYWCVVTDEAKASYESLHVFIQVAAQVPAAGPSIIGALPVILLLLGTAALRAMEYVGPVAEP